MTEPETKENKAPAADTEGDNGSVIVKYRSLDKSFGDLEVIKSLDLDVGRGEIVGLIGPSGSGKTTILRLLMTLEEPTSGTIEVDGEYLWHEEKEGKLVKASEKHLRKVRSKIGMIFQHFNLFPHMKILENVTAAPRYVQGLSKEEARKQGKELLEKVGLGDKFTDYPSQLSGGQQQRVAIARALVMKPKVMLFDEVTAALDPELVGEVLEVIEELAEETEMTMLIVSHEMGFIKDVADRVLFLCDGNIVEEGPPEYIFERPDHPRTQQFLERFINL
jgi:polar amino acid transport system ATP-binding protein